MIIKKNKRELYQREIRIECRLKVKLKYSITNVIWERWNLDHVVLQWSILEYYEDRILEYSRVIMKIGFL